MSIAKMIELSARSDTSFEDAITSGIAKAGETVQGIREVWVKNMKAQVTDNEVTTYQVDLKVTFVVE